MVSEGGWISEVVLGALFAGFVARRIATKPTKNHPQKDVKKT